MKRAGFTLAETVVALSLFAAAALTLVQAAGNAREALMRLDRADPRLPEVARVRQELLAITDREILEEGGEIELPRHVRKAGKHDGSEPAVATEPIRARWEAEVVPTSLLDMHLLTIKVTLERDSELSGETIGTYYVYRPGWYEAEERDTLLRDKRDEWERRQLDKGR